MENVRTNGKVKQDIIAALGAIDATWLESFWASAPDPALRIKDWEMCSLQARSAFWQEVLDRMAAIGDNRLNKDQRVAIRRAIHKVVPWVMEPEKKRLAVLEAQHEYDGFKDLYALNEDGIKRAEEMIKDYSEEIQERQSKSAEVAEQLLKWGSEIADLSKQ